MKSFIPFVTAFCLLTLAQACLAHDSTERNPNTLHGISSVYVQVKDKSKISAMPSDTLIKSQFENLLQTQCQLTIVPESTPGAAEVHMDLLTIPVVGSKSKVNKTLALVRTSVWRPVLLTLSDGKTADTSQQPVKMAGWVTTTITDPTTDPQLANVIAGHVQVLQSSLRAAGALQSLPSGYSDAFFLSRLLIFEKKLENNISNILKQTPGVTSSVTVSLSLQNGLLTYQFHGSITTPTKTYSVEDINSQTTLDLAGLSLIGALPGATITFYNPTAPAAAQGDRKARLGLSVGDFIPNPLHPPIPPIITPPVPPIVKSPIPPIITPPILKPPIPPIVKPPVIPPIEPPVPSPAPLNPATISMTISELFQ